MTDNFGNLGDMAQEHGDQVSAGVDNAGDFVDEKTGGQYTEQIQQGEDAISERLGAEPGAEQTEAGANEGLAPGDTQTQPTTDASVQPEGGEYGTEPSGEDEQQF